MEKRAFDEMSSTALQVRRATPEELADVQRVLLSSAQWLGAKGVNQWQDKTTFDIDKLRERDTRGATYIAWLDGCAVGTFRLEKHNPTWVTT